MCYVTHSLRFTSGATPADLLAASMAAEPSLPHTCEALVIRQTLYRLSYPGSALSVTFFIMAVNEMRCSKRAELPELPSGCIVSVNLLGDKVLCIEFMCYQYIIKPIQIRR